MRVTAPVLAIERDTDIPQLQARSLDDIAGKRILVCSSDGVGDEVLFASVYRMALEAGAELVIECDPRLCLPLLRSVRCRVHPSDRTVLPHKVAARYHWAPEVDGWIEAKTLFGLLAGSVPGRAILEAQTAAAWLKGSPKWIDRLGDILDRDRINVGVVWANMADRQDRVPLYPSLDDWQPILDVPGVAFWSLQYGHGDDILAPPPPVNRVPGLNTTDDLDGVIALCSMLDVVIAPACSVVWIANAAGCREIWSPRPWPTRMCVEGFNYLPGFRSVKPSWRNKPGEDPMSRPWGPAMEAIAEKLKRRAG